jgi:HAE1 family hydrophobic/amphiphilic exporter-1
MNLSEPFVRRPVAGTLVMAALMFAGVAALPFLPVAPLPQVDFPTVQVTGLLPGASAETMASSVAAPLERQLGLIAGVTEMTSTSTQGAASVTVQFDLDRNIDSAAQDVQAAINAASRTLPAAMPAPPTYRKLNPADAPILILAASSDTLPLTVVDEYADNFLARRISQVPGVAQVALGGEQKPSIRIQVDPGKMAVQGLTLEDARAALASATANVGKGVLATPTGAFTISANDQLTRAEAFDEVVLASRNGAAVRVRDVGHAVPAAADRTSAAYHDHGRAILLSVYKQPGANTIETAERVKQLLPRLSAGIPPSVKTQIVLDRTITIRASVHEVEFTLVLTLGLVVLVVLLFLRTVWGTVIPSIVVVVTMLGSFAAMYLLGFSLDNFSLMALTIAIGFVVDDAIVLVENIYRHVEAGVPPMAAALRGSKEVGFTVVSISVSLVAAFIPLLFMGGIVGRLFREFALTVTAAVLVSAFVSLSLAPMLCSLFMRARHGQRGRLDCTLERSFDRLLSGYRRSLDVVLRHQAITLAVFIAVMAIAMIEAAEIPKGFFPTQDIGLIQGAAQAAQSASPQQMMHLQRELQEVLLRDPDVEGVVSQTGSTGANGNAQTPNTARFFIVLKGRDVRRASASQIIDRLRPRIAKLPDVTLSLQPVQDITVGGRSSRGSFQYTLQGSDLAELSRWSEVMLRRMRSVPQIADVSSDLMANAPQMHFAVQRDRASRMHIALQAIDDTLADAYGQRQIAQYFTQTNAYPVILEIEPALLGRLDSPERLYVRAAQSDVAVPLSAIADIDPAASGPLSVTHQDQYPSVTLSFNLRPGAALGEAVEAIDRAAREIGMPDSLVASFQGNAQAFQSSLSNMPLLIGAALVVVYIVLGILYESFVLPLTILSTLPSAGVGALIALRAGTMDLSVIGIVGMILLIGIVKKNGIMLVDFAIEAQRDGRAPMDAIRDACLVRFRPILMTTAAAMLAGVPLAVGHGTGSELRQPLGYAMVGGLAFSQVLTLYTTPVVYLYLQRCQSWLNAKVAGAFGTRAP